MTGIAQRAEQIAAHLVGSATGADVFAFDIAGRQGAVDFLLAWPDGRRGALEVTLITDKSSSAWQGMAMKEGWRWPARRPWEFRAARKDLPYKFVRRAAIRAVELCETHGTDRPEELPAAVLRTESDVARLLRGDFGSLKRSRFGSGVTIYPPTRTEFVDGAPADFARVVETWSAEPHIGPHLHKLASAQEVEERHLFLVPTDEVLPMRFFTDEFELPASAPTGFEAVHGLWIWSNYWHRYLVFRSGLWAWMTFPTEKS